MRSLGGGVALNRLHEGFQKVVFYNWATIPIFNPSALSSSSGITANIRESSTVTTAQTHTWFTQQRRGCTCFNLNIKWKPAKQCNSWKIAGLFFSKRSTFLERQNTSSLDGVGRGAQGAGLSLRHRCPVAQGGRPVSGCYGTFLKLETQMCMSLAIASNYLNGPGRSP